MAQRVLLPTQLFPDPPADGVVIEHPRFFTQFNYHKQKLVLHRASISAYVKEHGLDHITIDEDWREPFMEHDTIEMMDPVDHRIRNQVQQLAATHDVDLTLEETDGFMASRAFNHQYFTDNPYRQIQYYRRMRERFDILVTTDGDPIGGKWSFDPENREKLPKEKKAPSVPTYTNKHVDEAKEWVQNRFSDNPGSLEGFRWPTTRDQARDQLETFLEQRLENFGPYQDAFDPSIDTGYHSLLSSSINIGLLRPDEVIEQALDAHERHDYPLQSLEGFIRQILGWREYVRALYDEEPQMREASFFGNSNTLGQAFYSGDTGIEPLDQAIDRVMEYSYTHHIERLMVLGNLMLLCEIDPDDVYEWFMELFIDAYDWVMVPNIYGMSQYAWPAMMTKPYISSSNYVGKMSHYSGDWEDEWDSLYWHFIDSHRETIEEIPRMAVMTSHLDRMSEETLAEHHRRAKNVIDRLTD